METRPHDDPILKEAIGEFFDELHISTWGQAYSLVDDVSRKWAVNWFAQQFGAVLDRYEQKLLDIVAMDGDEPLPDPTLLECLKRGNPRRTQGFDGA